MGLVAVLALTLTGAALAAWGGDRTYGPWSCSSCTVVSPMPDAGTRAYIVSRAVSRQEEYSFAGYAPGDKIVVCNATTCTTYVVTDTGDYLGIKQEPITPSSGTGGGGGSGGPPPGGGAGAPGCVYGACGPGK